MRNTYPLRTVLCMTASLLLLYSCKKNDALTPADQDTAGGKVKTWLQSQKTDGKESKNLKIQTLTDNLDFAKLVAEKDVDGGQTIMVPVGKTFVSTNNKGKDPQNSLILVADASGKVLKGNIIQYMPANGQQASLGGGIYRKVLDRSPATVNGKFSVLSITDWLLYEIDYADGKIKSTGEIQAKRKEGGAANGKLTEEGCWDLFHIHTYYDANGEIIMVWAEYITTQCGCIPGTRCDEIGDPPGGGGGGGGENPAHYPYFMTPLSNVISVTPGRTIIDWNNTEHKTIRYEWNLNQSVYGPYTWIYKNIVDASLERLPGDVWRFTSFADGGIEPYYPPVECATPDFVVNQITPVIAPDGLSATMTLTYTGQVTYTCAAGVNPVSSGSGTSSHTFLAN